MCTNFRNAHGNINSFEIYKTFFFRGNRLLIKTHTTSISSCTLLYSSLLASRKCSCNTTSHESNSSCSYTNADYSIYIDFFKSIANKLITLLKNMGNKKILFWDTIRINRQEHKQQVGFTFCNFILNCFLEGHGLPPVRYTLQYCIQINNINLTDGLQFETYIYHQPNQNIKWKMKYYVLHWMYSAIPCLREQNTIIHTSKIKI